MVLTAILKDQVRDNIKTDLEALFLFGAVGTDNTTPTPADTTLGSEVVRNAIDDFDSSVTNKVTAQLIISTSQANGSNIAETGWFDDPTVGTMWTRDTITAINKTSDIQLFLSTTITITVTET